MRVTHKTPLSGTVWKNVNDFKEKAVLCEVLFPSLPCTCKHYIFYLFIYYYLLPVRPLVIIVILEYNKVAPNRTRNILNFQNNE